MNARLRIGPILTVNCLQERAGVRSMSSGAELLGVFFHRYGECC